MRVEGEGEGKGERVKRERERLKRARLSRHPFSTPRRGTAALREKQRELQKGGRGELSNRRVWLSSRGETISRVSLVELTTLFHLLPHILCIYKYTHTNS